MSDGLTEARRVGISLAAKKSKIRPTLLPTVVTLAGAAAMEFGTQKYAVDDWMTNPNVTERQIKDALARHVLDYLSGEKYAPDSQVHHLGHIIANCGILLHRFEGRKYQGEGKC